METLKIQAYSDKKFSSKEGNEISILLNPESIKMDKNIVYREDRQNGSINHNNTFERYKPETFAFDFIIDCTGVVEGTKDGDTATAKVKEIEDCVYTYNSELHRPSFVSIVYGQVMFKGQITKMDYTYTLFNAQGEALRAKVSMIFTGFMASDVERAKYSKNSPDMSRLIVIKEGETLASICQKVYGDSKLVMQVARYNNLNGFRYIPPGTELLLPPLMKN